MKCRCFLTFDRIDSFITYCPSVNLTFSGKNEQGQFIEFEIKDSFDIMNIFHAGIMHGIDVAQGKTSKHPVHISVPLKEIENQLQQSSQR